MRDVTLKRLRLSVFLVLAIAAAGCAPGPAVAIMTTPPNGPGCYLFAITGDLVIDETYGTAILQDATIDGVATVLSYPVQWPRGYTGRRNGSQVEVVDGSGRVVAQTGKRMQMNGGYDGDHPRVWATCGILDLDGRNSGIKILP